jgi:hypothetical protein
MTDLLSVLETNDLRAIGCMLTANGRHKQALPYFEEVSRIDPNDAQAASNIGACLVEMKRYGEAKDRLTQAIRMEPGHFMPWINLGELAHRERRFTEARTCFEMAHNLNTQIPTVTWVKLAHNSQHLGEVRRAIDEYGEAFKADPTNYPAQSSQGMMQLLVGRWADGLRNYEARLHQPRVIQWPSEQIRKWNGCGAQFTGGKILVVAEQGIGDTFQFARYGMTLDRLYPESTFALFCNDSLAEIMGGWPGWDAVYSPKDQELPDFDMQIPLMSIPWLLWQNGLYDFNVPCLVPRLPDGGSYTEPARGMSKIGVCWRGNPDHPHDRFRSMSLLELLPIIEQNPRYRFTSLQKDATDPGIEKPANR